MNLRRSGSPALLLLGCCAAPLAAQRQSLVREWGLHSTVTASTDGPLGLVLGPRLALRTLGGTRVALSIGAGFRGDRSSARGEAALEYVLTPRAAGRSSVYLGGGLAGVIGGDKGGYLMAYIGLERSPGVPAGWAVEAGLGGGFRVRAAYHWRRFPRGWRPQK
ncbi:MAG TPA: hypothetical protein VFU23_10455 [Gemmatimonadales bacterium]|nr:hypothetical protein [Gemmatimonadales bacterium]